MLIAAAPALTAAAMPRAESAQVMFSPSRSGTLSVRAPGQMPSVPPPLAGAEATVEVAVPWKLLSAAPPAVVMFEPTSSGWLTSTSVSMTAISGLAAGSTGGATAPATTESRHWAEGESGSGAGAWAACESRLGSA
jgi:hypothetical protein